MPDTSPTVASKSPPYGLVTAAVLSDPRLKARDKLVYCLLALYADKSTRRTWVKAETLRLLTGHETVGPIYAAKRKLVGLLNDQGTFDHAA